MVHPTFCGRGLHHAALLSLGLALPALQAPVGSAAEPAATPRAGATAFEQVTARLEPGGEVYLFLNTRQWLENLSGWVRELGGSIAQAPGLGESERTVVQSGVEVVSRLLKESGLESLGALGFSGVQIEPGLYRTRMFLQRVAGKEPGWVWSAFGTASHPLELARALPAQSVLASSSEMDLKVLCTSLEKHLSTAGPPPVQAWVKEFRAKFEAATGLSWDALLNSWGGELGWALVLHESNRVPLPLGPASVEIPEPGLVLALKVRDNTLYEWMGGKLKQHPEVKTTEKEGVEITTVPVPLPIPLTLRPSICRQGDYLLVASTDTLLEQVITSLKSGAGGLGETAEFKKLARGLELNGNAMMFLSERFSKAIAEVQQRLLAANPQPPPPALMKLLGWGRASQSLAVSVNTEAGWLTTGNGSEHPAMVLAAPVLIAPVAIGAGMLLPALAKAKSKAQQINCLNNLKQIGLAGRIWATDHNDKLPPDWVSMKTELATTKILICPSDPAGRQPEDWSSLDPAKISYELVSPGAADTEPDKVFARCRIHGNEVRVDGSVQMKGTR